MNDLKMDRREFLKSSAAAAAVGVAGPSLFFAQTAMGAENSYDTVVLVFLRGGMDGLSLVVPDNQISPETTARKNYVAARQAIQLPSTVPDAPPLLRLLSSDNFTPTGYGLHPAATGLKNIWEQGRLAIVNCCGMPGLGDRSHFNTQLYLDLGTPGAKTSQTGWLTRAFSTQTPLSPNALPLLAVTLNSPRNVAGSEDVVGMASPNAMLLDDTNQWNTALLAKMPNMCGGLAQAEKGGQATAAAMLLIKDQQYLPIPTTAIDPTDTAGTKWPKTEFADQLWTVAQSIDKGLGLRYATLNIGGWDTHTSQTMNRFDENVKVLTEGLYAFYKQLEQYGKLGRVTVIVQSEFGRRVKGNDSGGTDHGYGNPVLILGGAVNGRRFYGPSTDLSAADLTSDGDVPVKTDYRQVFSEILMRRMQNNRLGVVFPGYTHVGDLGIVTGASMTPDYSVTTLTAAAMASLPDNAQPEYGESLEPVAEVESAERRSWLERIMAVLGLE